MGKSTNATIEDFKRLGLVETSDGVFKKASQVLKDQVSKEKQLLRLSKALQQAEPNSALISKGEPLQSSSTHRGLLYPQKKKPMANKKILNATKTIIDGITFDSKLEAFMYGLLKTFKIPFEMKKEFQVQEPFVYNGDKIRAITIIPDFWLPEYNLLIDTKGNQTPDNKIKIKMLKYFFQTHDTACPKILLPSTKEECQAVINSLIK